MASGGQEDNDFAKQMKNLLNSKFIQNSFGDQNKDQFHTGPYRPYGVTEVSPRLSTVGTWTSKVAVLLEFNFKVVKCGTEKRNI